jgi:hypothetical protein
MAVAWKGHRKPSVYQNLNPEHPEYKAEVQPPLSYDLIITFLPQVNASLTLQVFLRAFNFALITQTAAMITTTHPHFLGIPYLLVKYYSIRFFK